MNDFVLTSGLANAGNLSNVSIDIFVWLTIARGTCFSRARCWGDVPAHTGPAITHGRVGERSACSLALTPRRIGTLPNAGVSQA